MDSIRHILDQQLPLLAAEEERALLARVRAHPGSPDAMAAEDHLIRSNLRFVAKLARAKHRRNPRLSPDDLIAAGMAGLLRTIRDYQPSQGVRLCTYAGYAIRQAIDREIERHGHTGKPGIPCYLHQPYRAAMNDYRAATARTEEDLVAAWKAAGVAERFSHCLGGDFGMLLEAHRTRKAGLRSLSHRGREDDGDAFSARLALPADAPDWEVEHLEERALLARMLRRLMKRERAIVEHYFGLDQDSPRTLEETGEAFGVSRERVRQIVKVALAKIRRWAEKEGMKCSSRRDASEKPSRSTCRTAV